MSTVPGEPSVIDSDWIDVRAWWMAGVLLGVTGAVGLALSGFGLAAAIWGGLAILLAVGGTGWLRLRHYLRRRARLLRALAGTLGWQFTAQAAPQQLRQIGQHGVLLRGAGRRRRMFNVCAGEHQAIRFLSFDFRWAPSWLLPANYVTIVALPGQPQRDPPERAERWLGCWDATSQLLWIEAPPVRVEHVEHLVAAACGADEEAE